MEGRVKIEPGSFRDPDSRVIVSDEGVFRVLSEDGLADWKTLEASSLFERLTGEGSLVPTEEAGDSDAGALGSAAEIDGALAKGTAAVLRHERIPFVSYPYEWTFSMLKDAALLQLDVLLAALEEGMILKDATPYNVQWRGTRPVFVDIGSFERLREGEPWAGYRQFCMLFLFPLLLESHKDVPFHPWLRGSIDGITPSEANAIFSRRDRFRRGVFTHAYLHSRLERRYEATKGGEVKQDMRKAKFKTELIRHNVQRLRKLVSKLEWKPGETAWTGYRETNTYTDEDAGQKAEFVRKVAAARQRRLVWDLGCNDGAYSRIAAESASYVVATDLDQATVDGLYRSLRADGNEKILPLVANLADPSPGLGWRGLERRPMEDRGRPDLTLALALVHHVSITANVPIREFVGWLRGLGTELVIEFPKREDPMVELLLSGKREDANPDYEIGNFERELGEAFEIGQREELPSGTRVLYSARPRA